MILKEFAPKLWRGSHPQNEQDIELIRSKGIKKIINLQIDSDIFFPKSIPDIQMPCSNFVPPFWDVVNRCLKIMQDPGELPVLVHCHQGVDRTGYVVAAYRCKVQGWSFDAAFQEMCDEGYHRIRYWFLCWPESLMDYVSH